ncbi:MAG TPA: LuxR C-terminal-related transcriptional regulator [Anaerolinea sp.]|nr:LuxR C-terminal-related transcriptional regulator [Anaerolinea sp.]
MPEAILHALAAKDLEHAAGLIELAWPATEEGSIPPTAWLGWVKALPDELIRNRPVLSVDYAYALLGRGEMEAAAARLLVADHWLDQTETTSLKSVLENAQSMVVADPEQFKSLPVTIATGRAYIAQALGNVPDTVRYARQVLAIPDADPFRRSQASMLLGMSYWAGGDLEAAGLVFADYTHKLRTAGNIPDAISTTVALAEIRLGLGRLHEAIRTIEQMLRFVMDQGEPIPPGSADLHRQLGELLLEQGSLEAAAQHLQESKALGEKAEHPVWRYRWIIAQARFRETQGDLDAALTSLDEAERLFVRTPLPDFHSISAMKVRIWVAQGRLAQALEWVREKGLSADDELSYLHEFELITLARILLAQYQNERVDASFQTVMRFLDRLLQAAEEAGRMGSVIEILMLQALAHRAQGSNPPAFALLERTLTLAEPEGYVRIFVGEGEPVRLMIVDFRLMIEKRKREHDHTLIRYLNGLLAAYSQTQVVSGSSIDNHQSIINNLVESLSEREMDVLRLLRTDLNGPEIARELMVSLSTLRTHTQNIFGKLGVNNRRAAVRRAEELDLI